MVNITTIHFGEEPNRLSFETYDGYRATQRAVMRSGGQTARFDEYMAQVVVEERLAEVDHGLAEGSLTGTVLIAGSIPGMRELLKVTAIREALTDPHSEVTIDIPPGDRPTKTTIKSQAGEKVVETSAAGRGASELVINVLL